MYQKGSLEEKTGLGI